MPVLLNTAYFPPVEYFALMAKEFTLSPDRVFPSVVYIEACENYQKQSYRNRCMFYSSSGKQSLSFPIVHVDGTHNNIPVTEVRVDYSTGWVVRHERAISSAYGTSAYFDYYADELFSILDSRPETLFGLNWKLTEFFIEKTGLAVDMRPTEFFCPYGSDAYGQDFREKIHPKRPDTVLGDLGIEKPYFQVFSGKYGFLSGLSVMDLLFNEGPDSILWLKNIRI